MTAEDHRLPEAATEDSAGALAVALPEVPEDWGDALPYREVRVLQPVDEPGEALWGTEVPHSLGLPWTLVEALHYQRAEFGRGNQVRIETWLRSSSHARQSIESRDTQTPD